MTWTDWENELYHHGIKGQHWGQRRFQNEDGTLTEAGKARYRKDPEHLGYTPLKGKRGDYVQKDIAREQIKLEKRYNKLTQKREKQLAKDNGVESSRSQKLAEKAKTALEQSEFRREMQKTYMQMAKSDQDKIRRGMIAGNAIMYAVGGALGGSVGFGVYSSSKNKLINATDKEHGAERYYGVKKKS